MKIGSLCTGYGGLDMAVEAYFNAEMVWCAENDKYASNLIEQRFNKHNYGDIKTIKWDELEPIDILTAGYPCQPFSHSGHRKGKDDERHIWPYIKEAISILRPSVVILENVRGHLSLGFKEVLADFTQIGYDAKWQIIRASDVGAPHQRARLFVIAYPYGSRCIPIRKKLSNGFKQNKQIVANASSKRHERQEKITKLERERFSKYSEIVKQTIPNPLDQGRLNPKFVEYLMGLPVGWVTDLDFSRTQMLKMLGNGVVPQQAYHALEILCDSSHISHNETKFANAPTLP